MDKGRGGTWPGRRKVKSGSGRKRTREEKWMREEDGTVRLNGTGWGRRTGRGREWDVGRGRIWEGDGMVEVGGKGKRNEREKRTWPGRDSVTVNVNVNVNGTGEEDGVKERT